MRAVGDAVDTGLPMTPPTACWVKVTQLMDVFTLCVIGLAKRALANHVTDLTPMMQCLKSTKPSGFD